MMILTQNSNLSGITASTIFYNLLCNIKIHNIESIVFFFAFLRLLALFKGMKLYKRHHFYI